MSVPKTSFSTSDLAALTKAIQSLVEQQATNNKLVTAVLEQLAGTKPTAALSGSGGAGKAEVAEPVKAKRGRKPKADKEPKIKAVPPPPEDGVVRFGSASEGDYKEFSSFFKSPFLVNGKEYISAASYFHSAKFAGSDDDFAEEVRAQKNPALTRAKASSKDHAPRADWDTAKLDIMLEALMAKFSANSALRRKLLATGTAPIESTIEEEMRVKGFWSIGEDGAGANHMGKLLMAARATIAELGIEDDEEEPVAAAPAPKPKKAPVAKAAKAAPAPAPAKKAPAPPADADSDSDDSEEEAPAPKKPVAKATPAPKAAAAPKAAPAPKAAAPAEESDDEDSEESEDEE